MTMNFNESARKAILNSKSDFILTTIKASCIREIISVITRTNGNYIEAAKQLNVEPHILKRIHTGGIESISLETLVSALVNAGYSVKLDIKSNHF